MKGKIFSSSQDLYQDQAKILFDFYKDAAEKIVSQEEHLEEEMGKLKNSVAVNAADKKKAQAQMFVGIAVFVVGLVLFFVCRSDAAMLSWLGIALAAGGIYWSLKNYKILSSSGKSIEGADVTLKDLEQKHRDIFRDYKIEKMGVVYIPVASQVPFENKSFVIDHTGNSPVQDFELQLVNNQAALSDKLRELDELTTTAPLVEESEGVEEVSTQDYSTSIPKVKFYDYFGRMDRNLRDSAYYLSDLHTVSVGMPVISPDSSAISYLNEYGTANPSGAPVLNIFDTAAYDKEIEQFNSLNIMRHSLSDQNDQFEDVLRRLISNVGFAVQAIASAKVKSTTSLVNSSNQLLFTILKTSYNHYSPKLEKDELEKIRQTNFNFRDTVENYTPFQLKESSRVRYDMKDHSWVAEDGSRTTMPYGISQIQEEIVAPIVQNLMAETRLNRLDIYNDIDNQKRDYLNQWHRETQDFYGRNRTSGDDLINIMRSNLTKFLAAQSTFERLDRMKARMLKQMLDGDTQGFEENPGDQLENNMQQFAEQSEAFKSTQEEFKEYMKALQTDINDRAKVYGFIEFFDASLRDKMAKDIVDANDNVALLDERRRPLAGINPFYAFSSSMPPAPNVEDCVEEYMTMDVARVATDSLHEIAEQSQEVTFDHHAELIDDSASMEYSDYAPAQGSAALEEPAIPQIAEVPEVPEIKEIPVVVAEPSEPEVPEIKEVPIVVAEETPAPPSDDLGDLSDFDDLDDLDALDDLSDLEKDK